MLQKSDLNNNINKIQEKVFHEQVYKSKPLAKTGRGFTMGDKGYYLMMGTASFSSV